MAATEAAIAGRLPHRVATNKTTSNKANATVVAFRMVTADAELFEYWVHAASHVPTEQHHLYRWKMRREHVWSDYFAMNERRPGCERRGPAPGEHGQHHDREAGE